MRIRPFAAYRFQGDRGISFQEVLCPPYDAVDVALEQRLRKRAVNAIHLELPRFDCGGYSESRRVWRAWCRQGYLAQDPLPSLYLCRQRFRYRNRGVERWGFFAEGGLQPFWKGVFPHEKTFEKAKRDRRRLLQTLRVNTSPVFLIYQDPGRRILAKLKSGVAFGDWVIRGLSLEGMEYDLWRVSQARWIGDFQRSFGDRSVLIADGHHRYSVAYEFCRNSGEPERLLSYFTAAQDPGLLILPTHRVVAYSRSLEGRIARFCRWEKTFNSSHPQAKLSVKEGGDSVGVFFRGRSGILRPQSFLALKGEADHLGACWVHRYLLQNGRTPVFYTHHAGEALRRVKQTNGIAFFLKPFTIQEIWRLVRRRILLPEKSTYFYPKISTGLVFRAF